MWENLKTEQELVRSRLHHLQKVLGFIKKNLQNTENIRNVWLNDLGAWKMCCFAWIWKFDDPQLYLLFNAITFIYKSKPNNHKSYRYFTSPCSPTASVWSLKMIFTSCSQTGCRRRSQIGLRPPSHRGSGGLSGALMRSPSFAALCTQCRLGFLWRGMKTTKPKYYMSCLWGTLYLFCKNSLYINAVMYFYYRKQLHQAVRH